MALIFSTWTLDLLGLLVALATILIIWMKNAFTFWSKKGVQTPETTFLFGNSFKVFIQKEPLGDFAKDVYDFLKQRKLQHGGCYLLWSPIYIPTDPEIIKDIMQRDFQSFINRGLYFNEDTDPLSAHLFSLEDAKWRNLRVQMTPVFTSGKMKMMFETLVKCSDQLTVEMDKNAGKNSVDIKEILARFTIDIIGSCAFGIDCNSLKDPNNEFYRYGREFFEESAWSNIVSILTFMMPDVMRKFGTTITPKNLTKFFVDVVRKTVDYREKNNVYRKDFMHMLIQLKNKGKVTDDDVSVLSDSQDSKSATFGFDEIAAQAFVFFAAGFETSSTTMTFCLFELATNPEIQVKLRSEILAVLEKHDQKLTYDAISEMTYLDKVIFETLRKYPPLPLLNRICNKEYKIPGTDMVIEKGTKVFIPVLGLQRDEQYYPDPEKFDPSRFDEENKKSRHPYTFIPFGEGPRICLGLRFGMMQTKVGISVLLRHYRFRLSPKTTVPLVMDPRSFTMTTKGGIWLDYDRV